MPITVPPLQSRLEVRRVFAAEKYPKEPIVVLFSAVLLFTLRDLGVLRGEPSSDLTEIQFISGHIYRYPGILRGETCSDS
jgi:hypothetical protein